MQALKGIVHRCGVVSGYKINETKFTILGVNVDGFTKEKIQRVDVAPWKRKGKYLVINVSLPLTNATLLQSNLDPWMRDLGQQLGKWLHLKLSWFGRIAAIKMKALPRLLFLFWPFVLWWMKNDLKQIQKKIKNFIWEGKV